MSLGQPARPPRLSYEQIAEIASALLAIHHPEGTFPVPIDDIVELGLGIRVYPRLGLRSQHGIDGFISKNLTEISVDHALFVDPRFESRFRFTLAHELAHHQLHRDLYASASFSDVSGYQAFYGAIPEEDLGWYEWQGFAFAGLVLVPRPALKHNFDILMDRARRELGTAYDDRRDEILVRVCKALQRIFGVSSQTLQKRLTKDDILKLG
jgi:Zn-dependent peptidase ImmA (M78 family)